MIKILLATLIVSSFSFAQTAPGAPTNVPTGACLDKMLMSLMQEQKEAGSYIFKAAKIELDKTNVQTMTVDYDFEDANGNTKQLVYVGQSANDGLCNLQISKQ